MVYHYKDLECVQVTDEKTLRYLHLYKNGHPRSPRRLSPIECSRQGGYKCLPHARVCNIDNASVVFQNSFNLELELLKQFWPLGKDMDSDGCSIDWSERMSDNEL